MGIPKLMVLTNLEYLMLAAEGCWGIPSLWFSPILGWFSVWCSFIPCEKTSTQKLSHSFEFQLDSFWVFWYFGNVCNLIHSLDTLNQILFGGFMAACILSLWPLMSPPQKRNGKEFCGEVFHREGRTNKQRVIQEMVKDISLGMPHGTPLDLLNSQFAHLLTLFF